MSSLSSGTVIEFRPHRFSLFPPAPDEEMIAHLDHRSSETPIEIG